MKDTYLTWGEGYLPSLEVRIPTYPGVKDTHLTLGEGYLPNLGVKDTYQHAVKHTHLGRIRTQPGG